MAERVRIESSKRNGWPSGGQRMEESALAGRAIPATETEVEIHSGVPCTKRAKLAPPATPSSGGLAVAAGSGEGAPTGSEDQEEQFGPDRINDLPDAILGEVISRLSTREGIRTRMLARRWRPVWPTAPLNLDCREIHVARLFNALETVHVEIISRVSAYSEELARIRYIGTWHQGKTVPGDGSCLPESILSSHVDAIPDHYVEVLELQLVKRLLLVEVDISDFSLQSMINSSCPALECLLLVCNRERHRITINSPNLVSIGIRGEKGKFIIEDAPSLQRLIHDLQSNNMEVFIVSAPKLETLAKFRISLDSTGLMGLATASLSTMRQSVKTLFLAMTYKVDLVIHLLKCLPNLENLFVQGGNIPDGARNIWHPKHRAFLKEHIIHLKTVTLEDYEKSRKNTEFVRFFILNAMELETIRIKFRFPETSCKNFTNSNRSCSCGRIKFPNAPISSYQHAAIICAWI
ncbi:F-box/FBD/LRR-repeat protein At1g13570-like [Aegilops tauschii subsp. strangulata]|uniref:F-box/FBD/LRR-repeat protein At1g13570-like n=1 Tax=Aegilops tauschii subsp. strangulata TaxID=200361 RepID=UPI00098B571E|nr:F-box/FBD/LRR-repeat protein At1g16930-like [Aegilops tauschii subsp. strangulata]